MHRKILARETLANRIDKRKNLMNKLVSVYAKYSFGVSVNNGKEKVWQIASAGFYKFTHHFHVLQSTYKDFLST